MEFENQQHEDFIAYPLWKLLTVQAQLRVLFCYRDEAADAARLRKHLEDEVVSAMGTDGPKRLGKTLLVFGGRANAETFPHGFFKWWVLENNTGKFEQFW